MSSKDLLQGQLATVQSSAMPFPPTIVAAATIEPETKMAFVSGQTQIANITPPASGYVEITLCFTHAAPGAFLTNGTVNPIKTAYQPIQDRPIDLCWDPSSKFWYVKSDKA